MKSIFLLSVLLASSVATPLAAKPGKVSYDEHKVFRVKSRENFAEMQSKLHEMGLDEWHVNNIGEPFVDVMVAPDQMDEFLSLGYDTTVFVGNVADAIAEEEQPGRYNAKVALDALPDVSSNSYFDNYHNYNDHIAFLTDLAAQFPDKAEILSAGKTYEGRDITAIHFWGQSKGKPAIIMQSTVHAREWVTTMVNEYIAYDLLTMYSSDAKVKSWLDKYDFYVFPFSNPDGFVYSQTNERMWRKNRMPVSSSFCQGIDINRNWPFQWNVQNGASTDPCAQDYRGTAANSAPETKALVSFATQLRDTTGIQMYMDWHAYAQLWMTPFGYSCDVFPQNDFRYQQLIEGATAAVKTAGGQQYDGGRICPKIYQVSGGSVDYMDAVANTTFAFTAELRDTGNYGFLLPANQIRPTAIESYAGIQYLLENM
ncbi:zinc carboxypeptidase [Eremomyces bilateralis CBS 781.70]|uniref:Zinc carboxypeptidase n=1 Tax=Eremomyces bilateralis CBS 781.70 TaxID=1392243 RepID=A0A6G1FQU9_9PEZI|nr:zinc carboxypeptidase [Eremomyces bilateralis CBS 781.70]KAF1808059.1 zinc carboxypeptidase [Eremomyces bilateralis CBS 781.70]